MPPTSAPLPIAGRVTFPSRLCSHLSWKGPKQPGLYPWKPTLQMPSGEPIPFSNKALRHKIDCCMNRAEHAASKRTQRTCGYKTCLFKTLRTGRSSGEDGERRWAASEHLLNRHCCCKYRCWRTARMKGTGKYGHLKINGEMTRCWPAGPVRKSQRYR